MLIDAKGYGICSIEYSCKDSRRTLTHRHSLLSLRTFFFLHITIFPCIINIISSTVKKREKECKILFIGISGRNNITFLLHSRASKRKKKNCMIFYSWSRDTRKDIIRKDIIIGTRVKIQRTRSIVRKSNK